MTYTEAPVYLVSDDRMRRGQSDETNSIGVNQNNLISVDEAFIVAIFKGKILIHSHNSLKYNTVLHYMRFK